MMKKMVMAAFCLSLLPSLLPSVAIAKPISLDGQQAKPTISVAGEAELRVVPNQVIISMTIETRGPELLPTKKRNDQIVKSVLAYVTQEAKVDKKHVQTDYVSVTPEYQNCHRYEQSRKDCNPLEIVYFQTRKGLQIRLNDLARYEDIITKSLELGVTTLDTIQFVTTELRKHKDTARELAAKAAQEKAKAVAGTLNMKVLKPISIRLDHSNAQYWNGRSQSAHRMMLQNSIQDIPANVNASSDGGNLSLGQITIRAKVTATFAMQ